MSTETTEVTRPDHLAELGVTEDLLTGQQRRELDDNGYIVLPGVLDDGQIADIKRSLAAIGAREGKNAGHEYTLCDDGAFRIHNLLDKDTVYDICLNHPVVLAAVQQVLGSEFRLSMLNMRSQLPGQRRQKLHVDWYEGAESEFKVCNAIWALDDFVPENGATSVVPGSHRWDKVPKEVVEDRYQEVEGEVQIVAKAGDVIIFNSHLWHRGMDNLTQGPRAGINTFFCRADQTPELNQDALLGLETRQRFGQAELHLLGLR